MSACVRFFGFVQAGMSVSVGITACMALHWKGVIDTSDAPTLADFWAAALGYEVEDQSVFVTGLLAAGHLAEEETVTDGDRRSFRDVATCRGPGPRIFVQRVPETKAAKNRVHLDLQVGPEDAPAEVERLVGLGAEVLWVTSDRGPATTTLRDPEGNEFCVS